MSALTNNLGIPSEHYVDLIEKNYLGCFDPQILKDEFENVIKIASTSNGFSSIKIMANQIQPLGLILNLINAEPKYSLNEAFIEAFKNSYFIRVYREDKIAQAVSRYLALKTQIFHSINRNEGFSIISPNFIINSSRDDSGVDYNFDEIKSHWNSIINEETFLNRFIDDFNLKVLNIKYEIVSENREYISHLYKFLNIHPRDFEIAERRLLKISSQKSIKFIELFKNDMRLQDIKESNI